MIKYMEVMGKFLDGFLSWAINKILRMENVEADRLSKFSSVTMFEPKLEFEDKEKKVLVEYLLEPSI